MLGAICNKMGPNNVQACLAPALGACGAQFKQNSKGAWRFFVNGVEVKTIVEQRALFLGCDGTIGSWSDENKNRAALWASCFANVWQSAEARKQQAQLASTELINFAVEESRQTMFGDVTEVMSTKWAGATRAIYLMFAVNLPTTANTMLSQAVEQTQEKKWSEGWCLDVISHLTFGPKISLYPHRYAAVKSTVETLFEIQLPEVVDLEKHVISHVTVEDVVAEPTCSEATSNMIHMMLNPIEMLFGEETKP